MIIIHVESEAFEQDAWARAGERLSPQKYDNLIEITLPASDRLIPVQTLQVGTLAQILDDVPYSSILTGYEQSAQAVKLIFGNVRVDLTKKLILERRM